MKGRPNILFITSDQHRADCFGFENPHIRTPHLDRLAKGGTRFANCITPNLVCQPSRASILTGLLPLTHGVWDNGVDLAPEVGARGFAGTLGRHGYDTAFFGKAHFATMATFRPTGTPECAQSGDAYGARWHGPYMGFEHVELSVLGHLDNPVPMQRAPLGQYERWVLDRLAPEEVLELWRASAGPSTEGAAQTWHSALPVAWHSSTWIADRAKRWLDQRDRARPFCAWVSFPDPHQPFDCPSPWSLMHDPRDVRLPRHREPDLDRRPWWYRASVEGTPTLADPEMRNLRAKVSRMPHQSDRQLAHMTANYYGMIALVDHNVGHLLATLDDLGMRDDTLVIFTTDHGDMLGNHGMYLKGPWPLEDLLRVGMIASGPGVAPGQVIDVPVSTLDITPTLCDATGAKAQLPLQGKSLLPLLAGHEDPRPCAYSEWTVHPSRCGIGLALRTVRTRDHKCTIELESGAGELYDLVNDPDETVNRFDDPGFSAVRRNLETLLHARPGEVCVDLPAPIGMA